MMRRAQRSDSANSAPEQSTARRCTRGHASTMSGDSNRQGTIMKNIKTIVCAVLSFAIVFVSGAIFAQANKDGAPPPPPASSDQPTTSVVVPSQAPSPRDNMTGGTEVIENPYGIEALWKQGDFVARGTLIILIIMSIGTW